MIRLTRNYLSKITIGLVFFGLVTFLRGQTPEYPNNLDLGIRFDTNATDTVKINGVFGISAQVYLEANSSTIPDGEWVEAKIELTDPDGIILDSYVQVWNGFNSATDGWLEENPSTTPNQVLFQLPWAQAEKWGPDKKWTISIHVDAPAVETSMSNNFASRQFSVVVPDLALTVNGVAAINPINGEPTTTYIPSTNYLVTGSVANVGEVMTQAGVYAPVVAQLRKRSGDFFGEILDEQIILLPDSSEHSYIAPDQSMNFTIENLTMPADASGEYVVTLNVNPRNIIGGAVMVEQSFANNEGNFTFSIQADANQSNDDGVARIEFVENSFSGESGDFRGLDPIFLSFAVRNRGDAPVAASDLIYARLILSKDLVSDEDDFVLREFNLGGGGIGQGLLSGETVNLTWFQQLPDNLEGDYYLLIDITHGSNAPVTTPIDTTPTFNLLSQDHGTTNLIFRQPSDQIQERPSISEDGRFIVFESPDESGIQQIYLIDRMQALDQKKLISKSYLSTEGASGEISGNDDSFRPQISADGRKIVFYSRATNLVIGDTNLKEDVFLYDTTLNTMLRPKNSAGEQLDGSSFYPSMNGDGSKIVFESDSTNVATNVSGNQIYFWTIESNGTDGLSTSLWPLTSGDLGSYSPSIDDGGGLVVFDSFATNLLPVSPLVVDRPTRDDNDLRDIFLINTETNKTYLASYNYFGKQTEDDYTGDRPDPGHSKNAKISGDGTTIVFESTADNLQQGGGIASVIVTKGGVGYQGNPTIEIVDTNVSNVGALGSGAVLALREDGINVLQEIKTNAIMVVDPGINYVAPRITIHPDPDFPAPTVPAQAVAYLNNPEGDVYMIKVGDVMETSTLEGATRVSQNQNGVGGNFGSRNLSISTTGDKIVYSTKSSNLLRELTLREDGKKFYNSPYILPKAEAILVGGIGEVEIFDNGSGYSPGNLKITDLSGTGSGAIASYQVDNRGRIVTIDIVEPGDNYNLATTYVAVEEPRGGEGFIAGEIRFIPTIGEGVTRRGGAKIHKVEMKEYGYGYKIGETTNDRFGEIFDFEGDGADLNEDGFPDGKINPDMVRLLDGSLYLQQSFTVEVITRVPQLLSATILEIYDWENPLDPVRITFNSSSNQTNGSEVGVNGLTQNEIRDSIITAIGNSLDLNSSRTEVSEGPVYELSTSDASFTFSALSGRFSTNNPQAVKVIEHSNMLINGSGYSRSTPIINQVPSIYGFSEIDGYPEIEVQEGVGRSTLLSQPDIYSDDIYLYDVATSENHRISTSSFGTPAGYLANPIPAPPSSRFPQISGNGRYIAFSSDVYGVGGLAFGGSNQIPLINAQNPARNIYLKDLKSFVVSPPNSGYTIDLLLPNKSRVFEFAPQTPIPIFANFDYNGDFNMSVYLNRKRLTNDQITLERYSGAYDGGFSSSRFTGKLDPLKIRDLNTSGEFSLELVAFGEGNVTIAVSDTVLFKVTPFSGSLPPRVKISQPREVFTSESSFPISAFADDPDGAVNSVTFFVNGVPVMDESNYSSILRTPGIVEENVIYSTNIKISELIDLDTYALDSESGILSIVAIAYDTSGNAVSSEIINLSYTKGNENTPKIDLSFGGDYKDLSRPYKDINYVQLVQGKDFNLTLGANNKITSVDLNISTLLNADLNTTKRFYQLDVFSRNGGEGAKLDLNHTSSTVEVLLGGTGYTNDHNTTITITPILRSYNQGEEAILTPNNLGTAIVIKQNPAGVPYIGSGYSIFPRARPLPANSFPDSDSLPIALESPESPSSSIDNGFVISFTDMVSTSYDVFGGFTQSPILLSVDVNQTHEAIESVSLLIDGTFSEELTKYEPSYVDSGNSTIQRFDFSWIPEISKYYSISAIVTDMGGNVVSTQLQNVYIENFYAGGISLQPIGEPEVLVESTESIFLSADVVSQFDIEQVEFFIDDQWVGKGENRGGTNFQTSIDLEPYNFRPGRYEISYRAIDEMGNMAGTFSRFLTNLTSRQNHILTIVPPASLADTNVSMVSPVTEISVPKNSTLRLTALAQDTSGNLMGLRFFSPQSVEKGPLYSWRQIIDLNATGIFNDANLSSIDNLLDGTFLKIDDGTGKDSITLEFDADQTVQAQTKLPIVVGGTHNLRNDFSISAGSTFTHYHSLAFLFEIDGVTGTTDTFKWSKDGGITFVGEKIPITPGAIPLNRSFGIDVEFSSITGHGLGDSWSFIAYPKNHIVQIDSSVDPTVKLIRTRNFLTAAINEAQELGLTSIRSSTTDDASLLFLNHLNDEHYKDVNVSGNSLIPEGGLLQTAYELSDYRHVEGVSENYDGTLIMPRVADSRRPQPFGLTWEANDTGQFYFYALSEDFADSQSVSQSIKVTVTDPVGKVPVIELTEISDTISYMGSALSIPLLAEASDPDGEVAFVEFYVNGELIQEDNARPFRGLPRNKRHWVSGGACNSS